MILNLRCAVGLKAGLLIGLTWTLLAGATNGRCQTHESGMETNADDMAAAVDTELLHESGPTNYGTRANEHQGSSPDGDSNGHVGAASRYLIWCEPRFELEGTRRPPDRARQGYIIEFQNPESDPGGQGVALFMKNCTFCHYNDRNEIKVGPGLKGLSLRDRLPATGLPVNAENLHKRIVNGGERMPAFKNLKDDEVATLIDYLLKL